MKKRLPFVVVASFAIFFALVLCQCAAAQQTAPWALPAFSADPAALLQAASQVKRQPDADITMLWDGTEIHLDAENRMVFRVHMIGRIENADGAHNWTQAGMTWAPWRQQRPEIRARVIAPDGTVHTLDPKALTDAPAGDERPEVYDDNRNYSGPLPAVVPGAIVEVEEVLTDKEPNFAAGALQRVTVGRRGIPVEHTQIVVEAPAGAPLQYKTLLLPSMMITKEKENGIVRLTFEQGPMPARLDAEPNLPSDVPDAPQVLVSTAPSWQALAQAYLQMAEPQIKTEQVHALVARTIGPGDSPAIILEKLLAVLHREVRYTGVEFGQSKLLPAVPADVLARQYGDCKDKATLLVALLRAAGVPANLALLSAGPGFDTEPDLPGVEAFDHAIVHIPGPPEIWVDATAEFSRAGTLPAGDQGRRALIIAAGTTGLTTTPESHSADNGEVETREVFLSEYGPGRVVETTSPIGTWESGYRSTYSSGITKEQHDQITAYVKNAYLGDSIASVEAGDARDLRHPFQLRLEALKCRRAYADLETALVVPTLNTILSSLPEAVQQEDNPAATSKPPRTSDFVFTPFHVEWQYVIHVPAGFRLRSTPANRTRHLGPATVTEEYFPEDHGVVRANFRFDTGKGRYTLADAKDLRAALKEFRAADFPLISFEQAGAALLAEGKGREGLQADEALVAQSPKDALPQVHLASALLDLGLGEKARQAAATAIQLDPKSAVARQVYGWVLEHDLIGRRFAKGFDLGGAVAQYRKAKEIDPADISTRANLAILMEHDPAGIRYASDADLAGAITEYRAMRDLKDDHAHDYDVNLLYATFYSQKYKDVSELAATLAPNDTVRAISVAAAAAADGAAAGLLRAAQLTSNDDDRAKTVAGAATLLVRAREYGKAADLLDSIAASRSNAASIASQVALLRATHPYQQSLLPASDPRSVPQQLIAGILLNNWDEKTFEKILARDLRGREKDTNLYRNVGYFLGTVDSDTPPQMIADIILSNLKLSVDGGDDMGGYRIRMTSPGTRTQTVYVVKEDGEYRLAAFEFVFPLGQVALARLDANDAKGAARWLDWAREELSAAGPDDPLAGSIFARLWTRGDGPDPARIRCAAYALLTPAMSKSDMLATIEKARAEASEGDRYKYDLVLVNLQEKLEHWSEVLPIAQRLHDGYPDSLTGFYGLSAAYQHLKRWSDVEQLANDRLKKFPDDLPAVRTLSASAELQHNFAKARSILLPLVNDGRATAGDLNSYSWEALFTPPIGPEDIAAAQRGTELQKNSYPILHTLACLYAETGKLKEARDLLLQAMNANHLREPDSSIWYGFGRIAEQLGETSVAAERYRRVEKPDVSEVAPSDTWVLAQQRLAALDNGKNKSVGSK